MDLVLDTATSLEFWRRQYPLNRVPRPLNERPSNNCAYNTEDVLGFCPNWINEDLLNPTDGVLHVLAFDKAKIRHSKNVVTHAWSSPIPAGSFYQRSPHAYVESPEFMFLHAASILDLPELIALGDELCGLYSFDARERRGFRKRELPLLRKSRLEQFLQQADGCKWRNKALMALRHVVELSASPMETFDEMTLCLPYRLGGYSMTKPTMNEEIVLTPKAARIARRDKVYLDMGYSSYKLDFEHHGKYDHSTEEEVDSDRARVNALREMGFEVIELTIDQVKDPVAYEYIVQRAAKILGKRLVKDKLGKTEERMALRNALFSWNRRYGRIR